jgi:hypothetical protein
VTGRQKVVVWLGSGIAVGGLAASLVAWVGLDRANAYLGVPAALAALAGLVVSVYALRGEAARESTRSGEGRRVRQRAKASKGGRVMQIGARVGAGPSTSTPADLDQRASARGQGQIEQIGTDAAGERDADQA